MLKVVRVRLEMKRSHREPLGFKGKIQYGPLVKHYHVELFAEVVVGLRIGR